MTCKGDFSGSADVSLPLQFPGSESRSKIVIIPSLENFLEPK